MSLRERMERCRALHDVTPSSATRSGVVYDTWLEGPDGIGVLLFREKHHTDEDIEKAKRWLKNQRDVVTFKVEHCDPPQP